MTTPIEQAVKALEACAADLQSEIDARYNGSQDKYPSEMVKYQRDIFTVTNARNTAISLRALTEPSKTDEELARELKHCAKVVLEKKPYCY